MLRTAAILFIALAFVPPFAFALDRSHGSKQGEQRRNKKIKSFLPVDMKTFSVRGQSVTLVERKNRRGQVIEQYLISKDRTEISRDPKGLGFLESWELVTPGRRIHMHEPRKGHFSLMEVEQVTKKFIYDMSFVRTDAGKYRLLKINTRKFGPQLSTMPVEVIAGCKSTEPKLATLAGEMNEIVKAANPSDIDSVINEKILDKSCSDEPFNDGRKKDILEAIRTVFKSDNDWSVALAEDVHKNEFEKSVKTQGSYLQCLRYHELDTHASRIEAALAGYIGASVGKHTQFPWKIKCSTASYYQWRKDYGSFTPSIGTHGENKSPAPTITFIDNYALTGGLPPRGPGDEPYAKTFFHEMLHYSLIGDGPLLDTIVDCCVPGPGKDATDPNSSSCKSLNGMVRKLELTQQVTNQFAKLFGTADFTGVMSEVKKTYGTEDGQQMMYKVFEDIGGAYRELEQNGKCDFSKKENITDDCERRVKAEIYKVLKNDLKDQPALREMIMAKFDIKGAAGNSYCVPKPILDREKAMNFFRQDFAQQVRQVAAWFLPAAWAGGTESDKYFCAIANEKPKGPVDISLPGSDYSEAAAMMSLNRSDMTVPQKGDSAIQSLIAANPELNERAGKGDGSSSPSHQGSNPSSSGGTASKRYDQPEAPGPRRTRYSENPSERAIQIENLYKNEESGVTGYFNRLAAKLETVTVPEAKASDSTSAEKGSARESGSSSAAGSASSRGTRVAGVSAVDSPNGGRQPASENFNVKAPSFDVPDPFRSAGALGSAPGLDGIGPAVNKNRAGVLAGSQENQGARTLAAASTAVASGVGVSRGSARASGVSMLAPSPGVANVASAGKAAAGKVAINDKSDRKPAAKGNDRAAQALLAHLQKKFSLIKQELRRPSVVKSMQRHFIQAIDDRGRVYGSGFPKPGRKLIYNKEKDRLVPEAAAEK